jgi:hypothetical protein
MAGLWRLFTWYVRACRLQHQLANNCLIRPLHGSTRTTSWSHISETFQAQPPSRGLSSVKLSLRSRLFALFRFVLRQNTTSSGTSDLAGILCLSYLHLDTQVVAGSPCRPHATCSSSHSIRGRRILEPGSKRAPECRSIQRATSSDMAPGVYRICRGKS